MGEIKKVPVELKVNKTVSPTWNSLKLNHTDFKEDIEFNKRGEYLIRGIPAGLIVGSEDIETTGRSSSDVPCLGPDIDLIPGMGEDALKFFNENLNDAISIRAMRDAAPKKPLRVSYQPGNEDTYIVRQRITAEENSSLTVIMDYSGKKEDSGFFGVTTLINAGPNSTVNIIKLQVLGKGFKHFENIGGVVADNARVNIIQMILGSAETYAGLSMELKGYKSRFEGNVGYLCLRDQKLDMNYYIGHAGRKSESSLRLEGALGDQASKVFRGTIDLKKGAKGAKGNETEGTLLLSKDVRNKTLPVILCDEDDVEGEHGASIGRLSSEVLFYMQSRGIAEKEAKLLMTKAKLYTIRNLIKDERSVGLIYHYIEEVFNERR